MNASNNRIVQVLQVTTASTEKRRILAVTQHVIICTSVVNTEYVHCTRTKKVSSAWHRLVPSRVSLSDLKKKYRKHA